MWKRIFMISSSCNWVNKIIKYQKPDNGLDFRRVGNFFFSTNFMSLCLVWNFSFSLPFNFVNWLNRIRIRAYAMSVFGIVESERKRDFEIRINFTFSHLIIQLFGRHMVKTVSVLVYGKLHGTLHKCLAWKLCAHMRLGSPCFTHANISKPKRARHDQSTIWNKSVGVSLYQSSNKCYSQHCITFDFHFVFANADCARSHIYRMKYQMENIALFQAIHKWR